MHYPKIEDQIEKDVNSLELIPEKLEEKVHEDSSLKDYVSPEKTRLLQEVGPKTRSFIYSAVGIWSGYECYETIEDLKKSYDKLKNAGLEELQSATIVYSTGWLSALALTTLIGASLLPYYLFNSKKRKLGYKLFNKKPDLVKSIKEKEIIKEETLESKLDEKTEQEVESQDTKKYQIIEKKDFLPLKAVGYLGSLFAKTLFMNWQISNYVKPETKKTINDILERDPDIDGLTVRINHTRPLEDTKRLFTENQLKKRNHILSRLFLGVPTTLVGGILAKLGRADHYNPFTKTASVYSNIEAVAKHEIGHHRDLMRFDEDGLYALARIFPPVALYQEWKASKYAKWTLEEDNKYQFGRFLVPAFGTYLAGSVYTAYECYKWAEKILDKLS